MKWPFSTRNDCHWSVLTINYTAVVSSILKCRDVGRVDIENEWMFLSEQLHVGTCGSIAYFHWNLTTVLTTGQTTCTAAAILQRSTRVTHFRGFLIVVGSLSKFYHHSWIKLTHMGMLEQRFFTEVHKYVTGRWWRHGPAVNFSELTEVTGLRMAASCWEVLHGDTECSSSCAHAQWSR